MPNESKPKSIQLIPRDVAMDKAISSLADQLRTSRSGIAGLAVEFALRVLKSGQGRVVNGELVVDAKKVA